VAAEQRLQIDNFTLRLDDPRIGPERACRRSRDEQGAVATARDTTDTGAWLLKGVHAVVEQMTRLRNRLDHLGPGKGFLSANVQPSAALRIMTETWKA